MSAVVDPDTGARTWVSVQEGLPDGVAPADLAGALAQEIPERHGDEYLIYERDGEWVLAIGARASVELDSDGLRIVRDGTIEKRDWSGHPGAALEQAVNEISDGMHRVFGWVAFEFGTYRFNLQHRLAPGTPLARVFAPRAEVVITADGVSVSDESYVEDISQLIEQGVPAIPAPASIDLAPDPSDYRGRVGIATAEIRSGLYHKVILSRRVEVPFAMDFPSTYRLGVATAATDENREVRIAVANGLAKLSAGGEAVRALVHDGDPLVRAAALTALGELGVDDEILHAVEQALKAPAWQIRQGAVRALAGASPGQAVSALVRALADTHLDVRKSAVLSLSRWVSTETAVREALTGALQDGDADVRAYARQALASV
ncbi:Putative anthranilate synthase component I TrpE2/ Salicylate synthase MbtI [Mycobacteroides abscessus]|nr:Putative anthranilate synthase component I TrpE2/ Salicylate synthase MbtI [Mycobacteroides abscessus]